MPLKALWSVENNTSILSQLKGPYIRSDPIRTDQGVLKRFCLGAQYQELMTDDRCRWQSRWFSTPPRPSGRQSPHSQLHICQPSEVKEI